MLVFHATEVTCLNAAWPCLFTFIYKRVVREWRHRHAKMPFAHRRSISPTCLQAALMLADPKSSKSLFVLLRSACVKAVHKTLVKWTPADNFIIVYACDFQTKFWCQKLYKASFWVWNFGAKNFVQKCAQKNVDEIDTRDRCYKEMYSLLRNSLLGVRTPR